MNKAFRYGLFYVGVIAMVVAIIVMGWIAIYALTHPGKFPSTSAIVVPTSFAAISALWALRAMFRRSKSLETPRPHFEWGFWIVFVLVEITTLVLYHRTV